MRGPAGAPERLLRVLYAALALGVAVLAAVFLLLGPAADGGIDRSLFRWIWLAAAAISMIAVGFVRGRALAVETQVGRTDVRAILPQAVIIWAMAEGQALLGRHRPGSFLRRS